MAARVRLTADVDPELRKRVRMAAIESDTSVSAWVERAVMRELEREEGVAPTDDGLTAPPGDATPHETRSARIDALLASIAADREALHLRPPGTKPMGSENPIRLRGGETMAETIIEQREERDRMLAGEPIGQRTEPDPWWYREGMATTPEPDARPVESANPPRLRDGRLIPDAIIEDRR